MLITWENSLGKINRSGLLFGAYKHISEDGKDNLTVDLISTEALKTSEIGGELLKRDSIQSPIHRNFGLETDNRKILPAKRGIALQAGHLLFSSGP